MRITGAGLMLSAIFSGMILSVYPLISQNFAGRSLFGIYAAVFVLLTVLFSRIKNDAAKEVTAFDLMVGLVTGTSTYAAMPIGVPDYYAAGSALFVFAVMTTAFAGLSKK